MVKSLKKKVEDRLTELGRNPFEAARVGRLERSFVNDILIGKKQSVQGRSLPKLAVALDWPVSELVDQLDGAPAESILKKRAELVSSYDPDVPEQQLDPDAPPDVTSFPPDAIKELASKAGMGAGQTIATTYVADGETTNQRDAIRDDYWRIPPDFVRSLLHAKTIDLLVVECDGDSMAPTLMPKERVIVNTAHRKISPDGLYAMRNQYEDVVIKRLELFGTAPPRVRIISDNPKHEPQERGLDEIDVVGKVVMGLKLF